MARDLKSLHRVESYADIILEIDGYIGDGRARALSVAPVRAFLEECINRGVDEEVTYDDHARHPSLIYSTQIAIACMKKRAVAAPEAYMLELKLIRVQELAPLLRMIGALFCIHAAGAVLRVGHEGSRTLFDGKYSLEIMMAPVNSLAKFLYERRHTPEYDAAWEAIHEFTFSVVMRVDASSCELTIEAISTVGAAPDQSEFWFNPRGDDPRTCKAYLGLLYTAFWKPAYPTVAERWSLSDLFLTAEALAGPVMAVQVQFEEIMALRRRGFMVTKPPTLPVDQLYALRPLQENWRFLRAICFNANAGTGMQSIRLFAGQHAS
ncbi:hypothetical protein PENSPDRAFT_671600 [Peniophora sp. CONT]|nr:hypothetical protein PENSPDRAFT_671600 [Peniophora sp. CONT]